MEDLFPLVYDELRSLARARLARLPPGNTLQPTALVHDVFLRLEQRPEGLGWDGKGHIFAAASEAMRRILVDQARTKAALKRGGDRHRSETPEDDLEVPLGVEPEVLLTIHDVLEGLEKDDEELARIVKLRYFSELPMTEIAEVLGIPRRTLNRRWRFGAALLRRALVAAGLDTASLHVVDA